MFNTNTWRFTETAAPPAPQAIEEVGSPGPDRTPTLPAVVDGGRALAAALFTPADMSRTERRRRTHEARGIEVAHRKALMDSWPKLDLDPTAYISGTTPGAAPRSSTTPGCSTTKAC